MIVYRLAKTKYADDLYSSGEPNRWNKSGQKVIYTSENISLCALELLAHSNGIRPVGAFSVMHIRIAAPVRPYLLPVDQLPENWHSLSARSLTQDLGSEWYESMNFLCMRVPSAIIPSETNYVINTRHADFSSKVKLMDTEKFFWDNRFSGS